MEPHRLSTNRDRHPWRRAALAALLLPVLAVADLAAAAAGGERAGLDGLCIDRWDHLHSVSEPVEFRFRWSQAAGALRCRVTGPDGAVVLEREIAARPQGEDDPVALCDGAATRGWQDGWHSLEVGWSDAATGRPRSETAAFQHLARPGAARVAYLVDGPSPEEYAEWLNGAYRGRIEPLRWLPDAPLDLVVVSRCTALDPQQRERLQTHVEAGGTLALFGEVGEDLDGLSALVLRRDALYRRLPTRVGSSTGPARDPAWREAEAVLADAREDAQVLSVCADGRPFLATRRVGRGTVISCAGPLKAGWHYDEVVGRSLGFTAAGGHGRADRLPGVGISQGNIGRFGWTNGDRTDALGMRPDGWWGMWDVPEDAFRIEFPAAPGPASLRCVAATWVAKQLHGQGGIYGTGTDIHYGMGTPGVLLRNPVAGTVTVRAPAAAMLLVPQAGGPAAVSLVRGAALPLQGMDRSWLVLLCERPQERMAWPVLVTLNRRLAGGRTDADGALVLEADAPGLDVSAMPLLGIGHLRLPLGPGDLGRVAAAAEVWSRLLRARIRDCTETYAIDPAGTTVTVGNRFAYLETADPYGQPPLHWAPLPPLLPLMMGKGLVPRPSGIWESGVATFCGPLWGRVGSDAVEYALPVPDLSYPLARTPVPGDPADRLAAELRQRIVDHATLVRNAYLPVQYHLVSDGGAPRPSMRDLDWLTSTKAVPDARTGPYIDLHRSLGGTWGCIGLKPYLEGDPAVQQGWAVLQEKIWRNLVRDVGFLQHKTVVRYRPEPFGGGRYPVIFIGPVRTNAGHRIFHDLNETAVLVAGAMDAWLQTGGDPAFARCNLAYLGAVTGVLREMNDWAWMSSMAVEWGMGNNIDMLNSELPCWAALHRIHREAGTGADADFALYMASKASVSALARFFMGEYYNSLVFPVLESARPATHELASMDQGGDGRPGLLPYGFANGYGEGWPSLWPNSLSGDYLRANLIGIDVYNHSKGVCAELPRAYRAPPVQEVLRRYEGAFREACGKRGWPVLYSRLAGYALATGQPEAELRAQLEATLRHPGAAATMLGAGTADWEVSSMAIILDRLMRSRP